MLTYPATTNPTNQILKSFANLEQWVLPNLFETLVTTTQHYQKWLKQKWPQQSIRWIPLMISPHIANDRHTKAEARKKFALTEKQKLILFVGKLSSHQYYKDLPTLLKACQYLPKSYQLWVIGSGNKKQYFQDLVKKLALRHQVTFKGHISEAEMALYYKAADVHVLPSNSNSEGFGICLIEAMYCKTPTITTNIIGSAEWFFQEKVTTLIPPSQPQLLAQAIKKNILKPNIKQIKKAFQFAHSFSIENMVQQHVKLYKSLLLD